HLYQKNAITRVVQPWPPTSQPIVDYSKIGNRLFVGNIPHSDRFGLRRTQLEEAFSTRNPNPSGTCGAVSFATRLQAKNAFNACYYRPIKIDNHILRVEFPKYIPPGKSLKIAPGKESFTCLEDVTKVFGDLIVESAVFERARPRRSYISFSSAKMLSEALDAGKTMVAEGLVQKAEIAMSTPKEYTLLIEGLKLTHEEMKSLFTDFDILSITIFPSAPPTVFVTFDDPDTTRKALGAVVSSGWSYRFPKAGETSRS
ncbi:hypothetical protein BDQ17DRAFT_1350117, partial [Cyathus striatus]